MNRLTHPLIAGRQESNGVVELQGRGCEPNSTLICRLLTDLCEWTNCRWALAFTVTGGCIQPAFAVGAVPDVNSCADFARSALAGEKSITSFADASFSQGRSRRHPNLIVVVLLREDVRVVLAFGPTLSGAEYTAADRELMGEASAQIGVLYSQKPIASRVARTFTDMRRARAELRRARDVQSRLLPIRSMRMKSLDYYGDCLTGGEPRSDFFDFIPRETGLAISIGAVAGKGVPTAIMMAGIHASLRGLATAKGVCCRAVAEDLNRIICGLTPDKLYPRLFYGHIDTDRRRLVYVNAGHEPALLVRRRAGCVELLEATGTVLGLAERPEYGENEVSFEEGDVVVAFTDGVRQAIERNEGELCRNYVVRLLKDQPNATARDLVNRLLATGSGVAKPDDDKTAIAIRFGGRKKGLPPDNSGEFALTLENNLFRAA